MFFWGESVRVVKLTVLGMTVVFGSVSAEPQADAASDTQHLWDAAAIVSSQPEAGSSGERGTVDSASGRTGEEVIAAKLKPGLPPELSRFSAQLSKLERHPVFVETGVHSTRICSNGKALEQSAVEIQRAPLMEMVESNFDLWRKRTSALSRDVHSLVDSCKGNGKAVEEKFVAVKASFQRLLDSRE